MQKLNAQNLAEATRYLPNANDLEQKEFAERQYKARLRFANLKSFYAKNYCRMTRLHLLAASAIALGRFCGVSKVFDEIGESLMPIDTDGKAKTESWQKFIDACENKMPLEVREELWLTAHFEDIETVRKLNLEEKFYEESKTRKDEPIWQLLQQHLEVTLGVRIMDRSAMAGLIPHETAIADSLSLTVKRLFTAGLTLVGRYTKESVRAVFDRSSNTPKELQTYRRTSFAMMRYFLLSLSVSKLFRQGLRTRERGRVASTENWNLLEMSLGEKVADIHPLINEFYSNPSRFDVIATLKLETLPAKFWSRFLTTLIGQGLYESDLKEIPTRFRIFQREDGSMHFIRELYCDGKFRVFDSDFVVENGKLYEVFKDLNAAVEMKVSPIENRGLSIEGKDFLFYGRKMPSIGLNVEFKSHAVADGKLNIDGHLSMKPKTQIGQFFAFKVLRRPKDLGSIHYVATRREDS